MPSYFITGELDGVNLVPYMKGDITTPPHEALMWRWMAQSAIREGNWKLLRGGEREYLYDLSDDLEEKHNLASQHPDVAARLRAKLTAWCAELNPPGLALGPMASTWNDYFDFYLEGKPVPKPEAEPKTSATRGWLARGGRLIEKDGVLVLRSEKEEEVARIRISRGPVQRLDAIQLGVMNKAAIRTSQKANGQKNENECNWLCRKACRSLAKIFPRTNDGGRGPVMVRGGDMRFGECPCREFNAPSARCIRRDSVHEVRPA
jgi:hypothetical protein